MHKLEWSQKTTWNFYQLNGWLIKRRQAAEIKRIVLPVVTPWTTPSLVLEPEQRTILGWKYMFLSAGKEYMGDKGMNT